MMVGRSLAAGGAAMPQSEPARVALYASVGPKLTHYDVYVAGAALGRRGTVSLPANVQYAWPHASGRYLYVASSDSQPGVGPPGEKHCLTALRVDPASGALSAHGEPLPCRRAPFT
jgi:6-phosphogluconolactonase